MFAFPVTQVVMSSHVNLVCHQHPASVPYEQQKEAVADEMLYLYANGKPGFAWGSTHC